MGGDRTLHLDTILGSEGGRIKLSQCARPRQCSGLDAASLTALRPIAYEMKSSPFAPWCLDIHIAVRRLDAVIDRVGSGRCKSIAASHCAPAASRLRAASSRRTPYRVHRRRYRQRRFASPHRRAWNRKARGPTSMKVSMNPAASRRSRKVRGSTTTIVSRI